MTRQFVWQLNQVFPFFLVLARLAALFVAIPGIGERFISIQVRLLLAFMVALAIWPVIQPELPNSPENALVFGYLVMVEVFVGFFMGSCLRVLFSALDIAGSVIGFKMGITNAFVASPVSGASGSLPGLFMGFVGVILLFASDTHHLLIKTLLASYRIYTPADLPAFSKLSQESLLNIFYMTVLAFTLALQLATPFIILGLLYFISLGILNRLMPQLPVFFIGQPLQLCVGFLLFALVFSSMMDVFIDNVREVLNQFWDPKPIQSLE